MVTSSEAESTLQTIRSLMERATIYRAISAPVALLGGLLSVALSVWMLCVTWWEPWKFISVWSGGCLIVGVANFFLIRREAIRRGDPFVSPGMRLALRGIAPHFIVAVFLTVFYVVGSLQTMDPDLNTPFSPIVIVWTIFYGLGLLSTREFAPRSIVWLGYAFVASGLLTCLTYWLWSVADDFKLTAVTMGLTFGLFHLIYGATTWPRKKAE